MEPAVGQHGPRRVIGYSLALPDLVISLPFLSNK